MRKLLLLLPWLTVVLIVKCNAQFEIYKGFVISQSHDTLKGSLQDRNSNINNREIWLKDSTRKIFVKYNPDQILGYELNGDYYHSVDLHLDKKESKIFLRTLVLGKLSLFSYKGNLHVQLDSSRLYRIKLVKDINSEENKNYRGLLKSLTNDCKSLNSDTISSNLENLVLFITTYNTCIGSNSKKFGIEKRKGLFEIGLTIGQSISSFNLPNYRGISNLVFSPSKSIIFGVQTRYSVNSYSIVFDAAFNEVNFLGENSKDKRFFVQFNSSQLRLALGGIKSFPKLWATPYISVGTSFFLPLKFEAISRKYMQQTGYQVLDDSFDPQLGFWSSLGVKRKVISNISIFAEARIEKTLGYGVSVTSLSPGANPTIGTFLIGFLF